MYKRQHQFQIAFDIGFTDIFATGVGAIFGSVGIQVGKFFRFQFVNGFFQDFLVRFVEMCIRDRPKSENEIESRSFLRKFITLSKFHPRCV